MKILFAFGDTGSGFSGGELLVYRLANHLSAENQVDFVRLVDWRKAVGQNIGLGVAKRLEKDVTLRQRLYGTLARWRVLRRVSAALRITPAQSAVWPLDSRIRVLDYDGGRQSLGTYDQAIATNWTTAHFVASHIQARQKHYLIQNFEDSPVYSNELSSLASTAYALDLHKIVISEALKSRFQNDHPSLVIPGIDTNVFTQSTDAEMRPKHSFVLPLKAAAYKGTRNGFRAVSLAQGKFGDCSLTLYGNRYARPLAGVARSRWCRVLHNPSTPRLVGALNSSRFFLFPSVLEGFPVAPLEAMACGCVVIATPNLGTSAYLVDGQNAFVAKGFGDQDLYEAIVRAFSEADRFPEIISRGKKTICDFPWERTHQMFADALASS